MQQPAGGELTFLGHAVPRHFDQLFRQRGPRDLRVDRRPAGRIITLPCPIESARKHQTEFRIGWIDHMHTNKKPPGELPDGF